jgi:hypothetical protein
VVVGVSERDRLEGVLRERGVAAISGLPGVRLTGVAADSSCPCIQQKGYNAMLRLHKNKFWEELIHLLSYISILLAYFPKMKVGL